jgi:hypothetical protein
MRENGMRQGLNASNLGELSLSNNLYFKTDLKISHYQAYCLADKG